MAKIWVMFVLLATLIGPTGRASAPTECQLEREGFELLVTVRMINYASTGDFWSVRAKRWADEIPETRSQGLTTETLDGAVNRFRRYCESGDDFMAGLTLGEWIGTALRAP